MIVSCNHCKKEIAEYQKVGKGNLLIMIIDRIIESNFDIEKNEKLLLCPSCKGILGTRFFYEGNKEAFRMIRGATNIKIKK